MSEVEEVAHVPVTPEVPKKKIEVEEEYVKAAMNIINVMSTRGAFRPGELKVVGQVYEYFSSLVPEKKND